MNTETTLSAAQMVHVLRALGAVEDAIPRADRGAVFESFASAVSIACSGVGAHRGQTARAAAELFLLDRFPDLDAAPLAQLAHAAERAALVPAS